jgi:hypothetical protein
LFDRVELDDLMGEIKEVWKNIPSLDAQIRTIEKPDIKKGEKHWRVEVGVFESLGEVGGEIYTEFFDSEPTEKEIRDEVRERLKEKKKELTGEGREVYGLPNILSGTEEIQLKKLRKVV